jgi:hypothetical protein
LNHAPCDRESEKLEGRGIGRRREGTVGRGERTKEFDRREGK